MIPDHLRIQPGQQALKAEQEAEARRFAEEYIQRYLSAEPVNEQQAEVLLCQAYEAAGLAPPQRVYWLDGPLQLVAVMMQPSREESVWESERASVLERVVNSVYKSVRESVEESVGASVWDSVVNSVRESAWESVGASVVNSVQESVGASVRESAWAPMVDSVVAYFYADWLAFYRFFDVYLAPNDLYALARLNQMVSGYRLGQDKAVLVRRPKVLMRDGASLLHCATGKCLEYHDGWGFYCWHGVRVPEQVILSPERLSREDFLNAENAEVRRVVQERMGGRFVTELGGQAIDTGARGTLYEVRLPKDDPERVARYVQVQDASSERQYFLRVPPTIQTAAEAVAWSFGLSGEEYAPAKET